MEEAKAHDPDLTDLNSAIKNLRRCFGFPYQEYIGYMNTLTHQYRTRSEHEGLIDRIRRWAMFGNVGVPALGSNFESVCLSGADGEW
eukprot:g2307.t1